MLKYHNLKCLVIPEYLANIKGKKQASNLKISKTIESLSGGIDMAKDPYRLNEFWEIFDVNGNGK